MALSEWSKLNPGKRFGSKGSDSYNEIKKIEERIKSAEATKKSTGEKEKKGSTFIEVYEKVRKERKAAKAKAEGKEEPAKTEEVKEVKETEVKEVKPKKPRVSRAVKAVKEMAKSDEVVIGTEIPVAHIVPLMRIKKTDPKIKMAFE